MAKPFRFWSISIEKISVFFNVVTGVFELIISINFLKCFNFPRRPSSANIFPNIVGKK